MNKAFLLGNLGADPELKTTEKGSALKLRLATSESWVDKETNQRQERTTWHSVVVFGKRGEGLSRILKKGSRICVDGRIHSGSYEKDGQKKYFTEIIAEDVMLAGGPPNGAYRASPSSRPDSASALPF